ncbi:hypothetical protein [Hyphococcus sp.]|uniref:hypothetical protein n=1 Tax=Hyphococcus sp. TaxID=2038636 RepID=UPI0035C6AE3D
MTQAAKHNDAFKESVTKALQGLARVQHGFSHSTVVMPVLYPSGGTVVLDVRYEDGYARVSDNATAYYEATSYGVSTHSYARTAASVLEGSHVTLEDCNLSVGKVPLEALPVALTVLADFAREIVSRCIASLTESANRARADLLIDRLYRVFSKARVSRDVTLRGASTHPWHITGYVKISDAYALFEPVSPHQASVASVSTKFHDFRSLSDPPPRVSVVDTKKAIGDLYGVLAQASLVLERDMPDASYQQYATVH